MLCEMDEESLPLLFSQSFEQRMTIAISSKGPFLHHVESYQCTPTVEVSGRNILKDKEGPLPRSMPRCLPAQHEAPVKTQAPLFICNQSSAAILS